MKKLIFASAALILTIVSVQAQDNDAITKSDKKEIRKEKKEERVALRKQENNDASYQSKQAFYRDFGDRQDVAWTKSRFFDEATFGNNGTPTTAYYDFDGKLVGTTNMKTFADLPIDGQKQINKEYKDYTVKAVVFYDDNESNDTDMVLYGNQFDGEDNYFVELQKDNKTLIVQCTMNGLVGYFTER